MSFAVLVRAYLGENPQNKTKRPGNEEIHVFIRFFIHFLFWGGGWLKATEITKIFTFLHFPMQ